MRLDGTMIKAKAKDFYLKIKNQQNSADMSEKELNENFLASNGWLDRFKKRTGVVLKRSLDDQNGTEKKTFISMKD